jgi:hypothetical protein
MALKTAESDALKRAAIYLGTQFGLSLYKNGETADVVRRVLAPGQEWNGGRTEATAEQTATLSRSLGQVADEVPTRDINDDVPTTIFASLLAKDAEDQRVDAVGPETEF